MNRLCSVEVTVVSGSSNSKCSGSSLSLISPTLHPAPLNSSLAGQSRPPSDSGLQSCREAQLRGHGFPLTAPPSAALLRQPLKGFRRLVENCFAFPAPLQEFAQTPQVTDNVLNKIATPPETDGTSGSLDHFRSTGHKCRGSQNF